MMTMTEGENYILRGYRSMTKEEQAMLEKVASLIVRERLVSDQTVYALRQAIKEAYRKSYIIASRNIVKVTAGGETIDGMHRANIKGNHLY